MGTHGKSEHTKKRKKKEKEKVNTLACEISPKRHTEVIMLRTLNVRLRRYI